MASTATFNTCSLRATLSVTSTQCPSLSYYPYQCGAVITAGCKGDKRDIAGSS